MLGLPPEFGDGWHAADRRASTCFCERAPGVVVAWRDVSALATTLRTIRPRLVPAFRHRSSGIDVCLYSSSARTALDRSARSACQRPDRARRSPHPERGPDARLVVRMRAGTSTRRPSVVKGCGLPAVRTAPRMCLGLTFAAIGAGLAARCRAHPLLDTRKSSCRGQLRDWRGHTALRSRLCPTEPSAALSRGRTQYLRILSLFEPSMQRTAWQGNLNST